MLSLQVITQSKIRLTANNFMSYKKTFNNLNQKIVFLNIFISQKIMFLNILINEFMMYSSISKKNMTILNLIKNIQEFDLLCRQISSQFCRKSERNFSFALIRNEILRKMNCVFISQQKII